jgi:putative ABC transport system substrate-binding protein
VNIFTSELTAKRLGLLYDLLPTASLVAVLVNPNFAPAAANAREVEEMAHAIGRPIHVLRAGNAGDIDVAFGAMVQMRASALLVAGDPFFNSRRDQIVALAARYAVPAMYEWREFVEAGGLMSYGTRLVDAYRQQGIYAGRILKGEKPNDLPVMQLTKFELVINLTTAKALGVKISDNLLSLADEVIE